MRRGEAGLPTCCADFLGLGAARVRTACTWRCLYPFPITIIIIIRRSTSTSCFLRPEKWSAFGLLCVGRSYTLHCLVFFFRSLGLGWVCFALL